MPRSLVRWIPISILATSLFATCIIAAYLQSTARAKDQARFDIAVQETVHAIDQRLSVYQNALQGAAASFGVYGEVDRDAFRRFTEKLGLRENYPGLQGFGFAPYVPDQELQSFLLEMRQRFPEGFELRPSGRREFYAPVTFLQPESERNRSAVGFDMFSDPDRQETMLAAANLRGPAITRKVKLHREVPPNEQPGFLIYAPVFEEEEETFSGERREKLTGFVYAPLRAGDFFTGVFSDTRSPVIHFDVYDGTNDAPDNLIYASSRAPANRPQFTTTVPQPLANHQWTLRVTTTPEFESASARFLSWWVFGGGVVFSFMLFGITHALIRASGRAEQLARRAVEQREKYRVTLASIGDAVIATDLTSRITFMNSVAESLTQWSFSEARGKPLDTVFRILREENGKPIAKPVASVLDGGSPMPGAHPSLLVNRDGECLPIESVATPIRDALGNPRGIVLVFSDESNQRARQQAERELRDTQARLRNATQAADVGTYIWDLKNNRVVGDRFLLNVFDFPPGADGMPIEKFLERIHPADVARLQEEIARMKVTGILQETEYRIRYPNRTERWFAIRGRLERSEDGVPRLIGAIIDVTRRKRSSKELAAAKAKLERHAKNLEKIVADRTKQIRESYEELEAFSYSLSHDLRAPLRAIRGFTQVLIEDRRLISDSEKTNFFQKILASTGRMERLIEDVLALSHASLREVKVEPLHAESLLRAIIQENPEFLPPKAEITITDCLLPILGNEASLTQCITNLLGNAVKYVAPGVKPKIHIGCERRENNIRISIADNGIGMDEKTKKKAFEMFHRGDHNDYSGVGLGLSIVRKAVQRMNGSVGVESTPGQGSQFWIELPSAVSGEAKAAIPGSEDPQPTFA